MGPEKSLANPVPFRPFTVDAQTVERLVAEGRYRSNGDAYRDAVHRGLSAQPLDPSNVAIVLERLSKRNEELTELMRIFASALRVGDKAAMGTVADALGLSLDDAAREGSDDGSYVSGAVIVNTNRQGSEGLQDEQDMLSGHYAAVYYDQWQRQMENSVRPGDVIALYASGEGIIAFGVARGAPARRPYRYDQLQPNDYETFVDLDEFTSLPTPATARDIKAAMGGYPVVLHRAVRRIPDMHAPALFEYLKLRARS